MPGYWSMLAEQPRLDQIGANIASVFLAARQAKQQRELLDVQRQSAEMDLEHRRFANEQANLLPEARASAASGRPQMLQQIAPAEAKQFADEQQQQAAAEAKRRANVQRFVAQGLQSGGLTPEQAQTILSQQGVTLDLGPLGAGGQPDISQLQGQASAVLGAPEAKPFTDEIVTRVVNKYGLQPGTPEFRTAYTAEFQADERAKLSRSRAGASQITQTNVPPGALERTVRGKSEQTIIDDTVMLSNLDALSKTMRPEYMTLWGRLKASGLKGADYAGVSLSPQSKEYITWRRTGEEIIGQIWNMYRVQVTGAAASDRELVRLQKTTLNPDLGPTEFAASMQNFRRAISQRLRIHRKVLREGIDLTPEQQGQTVAELAAAGEQANSPVDRVARLRDLRARGFTPSQAVQRLTAEGYIGEDEAQAMLEGAPDAGQ